MLDRNFIFLNWLRLTFITACDQSWRIYHVHLNVYSVAFRWSDLQIWIKFTWSNCHLRPYYVSILIFSLNHMSVDENGILKSPTFIVLLLLFFSYGCSHLFYIICWGGLNVDCIYIYNCYIFFLDWSFLHYVLSFFVSCNSL